MVEDRTFMARVAEQALRPEEMVAYIKEVISHKSDDFTIEQRNLLSVAFKSSIAKER